MATLFPRCFRAIWHCQHSDRGLHLVNSSSVTHRRISGQPCLHEFLPAHWYRCHTTDERHHRELNMAGPFVGFHLLFHVVDSPLRLLWAEKMQLMPRAQKARVRSANSDSFPDPRVLIESNAQIMNTTGQMNLMFAFAIELTLGVQRISWPVAFAQPYEITVRS